MDEEIRQKAIKFAKANKNRIAKELTNSTKFKPEERPISAFTAGSPGAGKTEFSKNLIELLEKDGERKVIRMDIDEIRDFLPGYTGSNSHLFQYPTTLIVEKMQDLALKQNQTFVLDGTFSNYEKAKDNIRRSLAKYRLVFVFYVYQRPEVAWRFTEAREKAEGRNIPKEAFIEQFLASKENVVRILQEFKKEIVVFLVKKNFETHVVEYVQEIMPSDKGIDEYLGESYTKEKLEKLL